MWKLKKNNTVETTYKTRLTDIENKPMVSTGEREGRRDRLGVWD